MTVKLSHNTILDTLPSVQLRQPFSITSLEAVSKSISSGTNIPDVTQVKSVLTKKSEVTVMPSNSSSGIQISLTAIRFSCLHT